MDTFKADGTKTIFSDMKAFLNRINFHGELGLEDFYDLPITKEELIN